ncbi:hypothetical protein FRC17_007828 [Serendipita sp. 399]|nr:hypothetical protein FRC17_007828 [Serendipita sp. 399]
MKRWAMRPCFEERVVVWKAASAGIIVSPVQRDSRMGVAALEFSEGAEALAGLHRQNELPPPPSDIYVPASNRNKLPPPLVIPRSPHGMNHLDPRSLGLDKHVRGRIKLSSKLRPATVDTTAMDEDDLPLGVVMAHRRNKEETEERKRRAAAERAERERKAREEEERKRKYAEEVAAARARRDAEKSGKSGSKKDAWLAGEADALPPPIKPFATHYLKSSSNPNLASSTSTPLLSVPPKPSAPRRQTTGASSSASSFVASTTGTVTPRTQEASWQHSAPATPMPWTGLPLAGTPPGSQYDMSAFSGTLPNMPMSAPISQLHYPPTMMMLPPHPDPVSMAMPSSLGYGCERREQLGNFDPAAPVVRVRILWGFFWVTDASKISEFKAIELGIE